MDRRELFTSLLHALNESFAAYVPHVKHVGLCHTPAAMLALTDLVMLTWYSQIKTFAVQVGATGKVRPDK